MSKKIRLIVEIIFLFILPPFLLLLGWLPLNGGLLIGGLGVGGMLAFRFLVKSGLKKKEIWGREGFFSSWWFVFVRFLFLGVLLTVTARVFFPESFLSFPRKNVRMWLMVMGLYPFLSALPQELIYRSFFFHRYRMLLSPFWLFVMSSFLFAHLHIFYWNGIALSFALIGGVLFSHTYVRSRSLLLVWFEHTLYGCLLFTVGLGRFFYHGAI